MQTPKRPSAPRYYPDITGLFLLATCTLGAPVSCGSDARVTGSTGNGATTAENEPVGGDSIAEAAGDEHGGGDNDAGHVPDNPDNSGPDCATSSGLDSHFVGQSVPINLGLGLPTAVSVTMRNVGSTPWTEDTTIRLGSQGPQDNLNWGFGRVHLAAGQTIEPCQEVTFDFAISTATPGVQTFQWRMLQEGNIWFGESTSPVAIRVSQQCATSPGLHAQFVAQQVPRALQSGVTQYALVTMRNTGSISWTRHANFKLASLTPWNNSIWGGPRAELAQGDSIGPCQSKTFRLPFTSYALGSHDFHWRMVQEGVTWFGDTTPLTTVDVGVTRCEAAELVVNTDLNASDVLDACIAGVESGGILELPNGTYRIDRQLLIDARPITIRPINRRKDHPRCSLEGEGCVVLLAHASLADPFGMINAITEGVHLDHLVIDGNRAERSTAEAGQRCGGLHASREPPMNTYGTNLRLTRSNSSLTNSVSMNAPCGTGVEFSGGADNRTLWRNTIAFNGLHSVAYRWADGVTVHDASNSLFSENEFVDNTDIQLIFGGCQNCTISNNLFTHSSRFSGGAFADLMLHAWPNPNGGNSTSGDFSGTTTTANVIDCGPAHQCGIGLYLGSDAWYTTDVFGGQVYGNTIRNAQIGLLLDDVRDMTVHSNTVTNSTAQTLTNCGMREAYPYAIGTRSAATLNTAGDPTPYTPLNLDGCVPNWWDQ